MHHSLYFLLIHPYLLLFQVLPVLAAGLGPSGDILIAHTSHVRPCFETIVSVQYLAHVQLHICIVMKYTCTVLVFYATYCQVF